MSGVVYKFQYRLWYETYYGENVRHVDLRSGEHIDVSTFTGKEVKQLNNSAVCDHLLHCNFYPLLTNSLFWLMRTESIYWKLKKTC